MRYFILIWFAISVLLTALISMVGIIWTGPSVLLAMWNLYGSDLVHYGAQTAALALDTGGVSALDALEKQVDPDEKFRFFVFDSNLSEIRGLESPRPVRALASRLQPGDKTEFTAIAHGMLAGSMVTSPGGHAYRVVVWFPSRSARRVSINVWAWLGRIAAVLAGVGLLCSWLAWRLSTPLLRLRQAARRFASGDLKARAGAATFPLHPPEYRELAGDFDEMADRIEILVDSQRQLLRDVSHELRTPLTRLSLAVNNARHAPAPAVERSLDRIDQESERLNSLIDRIIRLSRLEAFTESPHRDVIEFADFLESIVSDANFEATAHNRKVSILRAETCRLLGDRELLREAIENMVRNAIRFTAEGTTVTVEAWRAGASEYRIVIRDQGPGVQPEHLDKIFNPFYRAPRPDSPGFGLGLAIAKRAIGLHDGRIEARNAPGNGLELTIHLPIVPA